MSAISNAMAAAPAQKKSYKDIYKGPATVKEVNPLEPRFTDGLTEEELASAFDIQIVVTPENPSIAEQEITISHSARHTRFDPSKTEAQKAVEDLARQGLCNPGDVSGVFTAIGKKCNINVYEETGPKGTFTRARLDFGPKKLSRAEIMKRIASITGIPAPAPAAPTTDLPF